MFKRISKELQEIIKEPIPGVYVDCDTFDLIHVLMTGPDDTPYENGFFYFQFQIPVEYPLSPPKVKFMTTTFSIRFNPNLYSCGKVCLSILGTWSGPGWTPIMSLRTVILSLLGLVFIDNPIKNEPSYEFTKITDKKAIDAINYVRFHTINYACLGFVNRETNAPHKFVEIAKEVFIKNHEKIQKSIQLIEKNKGDIGMFHVSMKIEDSHILKLKGKHTVLYETISKEVQEKIKQKEIEKENCEKESQKENCEKENCEKENCEKENCEKENQE